MIRNSILLMALATLMAPVPHGDLSAQDVHTLCSGTRIRVLAPPELAKPTIGRLGDVKADTPVLFSSGSDIPLVIPFSSVRELEVSRYRKSMATQGVVVGALVGGITMTIVGLSSFEDDCPDECPPPDWPPDLPFDCSDAGCYGFTRVQKVLIAGWVSKPSVQA